MDVSALQARLRAFAAERDWPPFHSPKNLAMALMVEAAELLELFQWLTTAQSHTFTQDAHDKERVGDEMADVLLYLLQLADHTGVDLAEAVERKLRKNAIKHPPKHPPPATVALAEPPPGPKVHLLVDWENVQPKGADLKALVPEGTDVWLFHGPQQKVDRGRHTDEYGNKQVTLVPSTRAGKNSLDFHLTYYIGYISARQPGATFVVVSNDTGYDPMLEHVGELGFTARRCEYRKALGLSITVMPVQPVLAAKKAPAAKALAQPKKAQASAVKKRAAPVPAPVVQVANSAASLPAAPVASASPSTPRKTSAPKPAKRVTVSAAKLIRQRQTQQAVQFLEQMDASHRPKRRSALLALLMAQLEASIHAPAVVHAMAHLLAKGWVVVQGETVSYPQWTPQAALTTQKAAAKKKAVVKSVATPPLKKPLTPAQMVHKVLASLAKMSGNRPTRQPALLAWIRAQIGAAPGDDVAAHKVLSLLQAQGAVVEVGKALTYPPPKAKASGPVNAA